MALFECPDCSSRLRYASQEHACRKSGKSSDGVVEGHERYVERPSKALVRQARETGSTPPTEAVAGVEPSPSEAKHKRGRPKKTEKQTWEIEGITRATWYRNQRRQKEGKL